MARAKADEAAVNAASVKKDGKRNGRRKEGKDSSRSAQTWIGGVIGALAGVLCVGGLFYTFCKGKQAKQATTDKTEEATELMGKEGQAEGETNDTTIAVATAPKESAPLQTDAVDVQV
jgi:hypothetical protein